MIYLRLFLSFLKIGAFTFGGGYAAVPLIRESVLSNGWLDDAMLSDLIAVSESTPGPIMVNMATYIGSTQAGFAGAVIATLAVVLPSFVFILLLVRILKKAMESDGVKAAFGSLKPCIAGIILASGIYIMMNNIISSAQMPSFDMRAFILTVILAVIWFSSKKFFKKGMSPILLILISGAGGIITQVLIP